jgi:hypothetical protein
MMSQDYAALPITPRELETITGKDVSDGFVGGVWGGVYRPSALRQLSGRLALGAIELVTAGLMFVFSLPIGLALLRISTAGSSRVLIISAVITVLGIVIWNLYMRLQVRKLKRLLALLDQVDHFNEMIATLVVLGKFGEDTGQQQSLGTTLELTRENLVAALVTERLLRENQRLLDRQAAFLSHLETNLGTMLEMNQPMDPQLNQQAQEYRRVVDEALTINLAVQREMAQWQRP